MGNDASIGNVTSRLTLDSAEFDSKLAKSSEGLDRHAALSEKASIRARAAWEKELLAQANAAQKTAELSRAKELAALKSDILSRSLETEAKAVTNVGHASVSQMQAASAAIRSLEGNPGIRAVERFLTTIPGVGAALKNVFPIVGAVAFAGVIADMGIKVADFVKKVREMPRTIEADFASLALAQRTSIDELDLANDKLQNAIDKMAKRPENNLKVAFDEAKLAADRLAASIENSNNKLNELLSKDHVSSMALLVGRPGTADREGTAKAFGRQADSNAYDLAEATSRGDTPAIEKAHRSLLATQAAQLAEARNDLAKRLATSKEPGSFDDSANINIDRGVITAILNQQRQDAAEILNSQKSAEKQIADDKKAAEEEAKQAAAKQLQQLEASLAAQKLVRGESVKADYEFWQQRQAMFRAGSEQYNAIVEKQAQLAVEGAKQAHAKILHFQAEQRSAPSAAEGDQIVARANEQIRREAVRNFGIMQQDAVDSDQLALIKAHNEARQQEALLTDKAGRSMTEYAAAIELAAVHAREFAAEMAALEGIRNTRALTASIDPSRENNRALAEAQAAIVQAQARRELQVNSDNTAINGRDSSGLVGATDALEEFVRATRDTASELRNLTTGALNGFNAEVLKGITGQRTSFGNFGGGLAKDVAGAALRKGEGSILSIFGLGGDGSKKPSGTTTDPLHVMVANLQAFQGSQPQLNNLLPSLDTPLSSVPFSSLMPGGGSMPSVGSLLGAALSFLPGFASGGAIDPNQWAIVGEEGPELFHSGGGGTIVPNDKIGGVGGGGDTHNHFHIDARNATDPAQVHRQIMEAAPHIAAAAVKAVSEGKMRSPSTRRG